MNPYDQALGKSVKKNRNRKKPLNQALKGKEKRAERNWTKDTV